MRRTTRSSLRTRLLWVVLLLFCPVLLESFALARSQGVVQEARPERAFDASLAEVRRLMKVERWLEAKNELLEALEEHRDLEYAARRLGEIRRLLRNCTFALSYPSPDPAEVVAGELLRYRPERREVAVAYRAKGYDAREVTFSADLIPGDFELQRGVDGSEVWVHPFEWTGPYKITLRGQHLPVYEPLFVVTCATKDQATIAGFGEDAGLYFVARNAEQTETLDYVDEFTADQPYEIEIQVGVYDVKVSYDRRPLLQGRKIRNAYGNFSFTNFEGIEEIVIEGKAEFSWFQRRLDAETQLRRLEFEERYDAEEDLPEWVRALAPDTVAATQESLFTGFGGGHGEALGRSEAFYAREDHERGLEYADALGEEGAVGLVRAWLRTLFLEALGRDEEALESARKAVELDPAHFKLRRKVAELVRQIEKAEVGIEATRVLVERFPERPEAHEDLVAAVLLEGKRVEARRLLHVAARRGIRSKQLFLLEDLLLRADEGPSWRNAFQFRSRYFDVRSDISRNICLEAGNTLDAAYQLFGRRFGRVEGMGGTERFPVYLFSGEIGYLLYGLGLFGVLPVHTSGLYTPILQQLLVWNLPKKHEVMSTLRHEAFHQYLHARVGRSPSWMNEGLAEYFELARNVRGRVQEGQSSPQHVALLEASDFEWPALSEFLEMGRREFYSGAERNYALAWLWVHYLERSSVPNKKLLKAMITALEGGASPLEAVREVFPPESLAEHERGWKAQLKRL